MDKNMQKYGQNVTYTQKQITAHTALTFMKFTLAQQNYSEVFLHAYHSHQPRSVHFLVEVHEHP